MNDLARADLERLCSYVFPNEEDNFAECLVESPEEFPGLTEAETTELENMDWGTTRYMDLLEKAATCDTNHHPYACAFRLHREFIGAERIETPCPDCGREEYDDNGDPLGYWYTPCPSDDCPSHDDKEPK